MWIDYCCKNSKCNSGPMVWAFRLFTAVPAKHKMSGSQRIAGKAPYDGIFANIWRPCHGLQSVKLSAFFWNPFQHVGARAGRPSISALLHEEALCFGLYLPTKGGFLGESEGFTLLLPTQVFVDRAVECFFPKKLISYAQGTQPEGQYHIRSR